MILVITSKKVYITARLMEEAKKANVGMEVLDMTELVEKNFAVDIDFYNVLYIRDPYLDGSPKYLPNIIALAKKFKAAGKRVVDSVIAEGELGEGKWEDYERLTKDGLQIPKTELYDAKSYILHHKSYILKWIYGFKGNGTFLIESEKDIEKIPSHIPKNELLHQEFIDAEYEYKVICVGYKALPVVLRFKVQGSGFKVDFDKVEVINTASIPGIVLLAEQASKTLYRELSKVDILQKNDQLYILEVNRWPGLKSFEELTKHNVVESFIQYLTVKI